MKLSPKLKKIIQSSTFQITKGIFIYAKVNQIPKGKHFMVTTDKDEITVVTEENKLSELNLIERNKDNYTLIALNVAIPSIAWVFLQR